MKKYRIQGRGTPVGSLMASHGEEFDRVVEAESAEAAQLKAYDTHEHIAGGAEQVKVTELPAEA